MSRLFQHIHDAAHAVHTHVRHGSGSSSNRENINQTPGVTAAATPGNASLPSSAAVDLTVQFISASGLPKTDVVGLCDPYFVASLDDKLEYVSTAQPNTLEPVWNEIWHVKNVPPSAILKIEVMDKDEGAIRDDVIGKFTTTIESGSKECTITGHFNRAQGTFKLNIIANPTYPPYNTPAYTFDGPIRFSRHQSPTVGRLTKLNQERLFSTWKIHIKGIPIFFGETHQHWNTGYAAAQKIFGAGPVSLGVRSSIQAGHRMLYARSTTNQFGNINGAPDFWGIFRDTDKEGKTMRVKPAVYTYVIDNDTMRFSETGAAFFVDFASKHALHANCATSVRYSGEFHPRPVFPDGSGWKSFNEGIMDDSVAWELVIDNNSGTYGPNPALLPSLRQLLEYNFPGIKVTALDFKEPALAESREACREYALKNRGVVKEELQPSNLSGGETLCHRATVRRPWSKKKKPTDAEFARQMEGGA